MNDHTGKDRSVNNKHKGNNGAAYQWVPSYWDVDETRLDDLIDCGWMAFVVYAVLCHNRAWMNNGWSGSIRKIRKRISKRSGKKPGIQQLSDACAAMVTKGILTMETSGNDTLFKLTKPGAKTTQVEKKGKDVQGDQDVDHVTEKSKASPTSQGDQDVDHQQSPETAPDIMEGVDLKEETTKSNTSGGDQDVDHQAEMLSALVHPQGDQDVDHSDQDVDHSDPDVDHPFNLREKGKGKAYWLEVISSLRSETTSNCAGVSDPQRKEGNRGGSAPPDPPVNPDPNLPVRGLDQVLRLPFVPKRFPNVGGTLHLGVQLPYPPRAKITFSEEEILDHTIRLWRECHKKVFGKADHRLSAARKPRGKKWRDLILKWWRACYNDNVKPAEWIVWCMMNWKKTHGSKKRAEIVGIINPTRVSTGTSRRSFRMAGIVIGGWVTYDDVGRIFIHTFDAMRFQVAQLLMGCDYRVTDDQVREVVDKFFPKGAENAESLVREVHQRCSMEINDLRDKARRGHFIWDLPKLRGGGS